VDSLSTQNNIIDKLRNQWSQYNFSSHKPQKNKQIDKKQRPKNQLQIRRDFHYKCPHCNEPIFYNQYWFDDFQNRYIPLSTYTHRPHKCYQKEAEKLEGLMNGTYEIPS
jgi:hypothetical protein